MFNFFFFLLLRNQYFLNISPYNRWNELMPTDKKVLHYIVACKQHFLGRKFAINKVNKYESKHRWISMEAVMPKNSDL